MVRSARFARVVAEALAAAFLDGPWSPSEMAERGAIALGRSPPWLQAAAERMHDAFPDPPCDRIGELASSIARDAAVGKALSDRRERLRVRRFFSPEPAMRAERSAWDVPQLATTGDVAARVNEEVEALAWLADWRGLSRLERDPRLRHYACRWMPKRSGGVRLLEAPKPRLKAIQRLVLREIVDRVPPHEAAHGFRAGRGVVSHARTHAGRAAVLRMDLEDFFVSIPAARVFGLFRTMGYPEEVSRVLTGLCTTRARADEALESPHQATASAFASLHRTRQRYRSRHLPQGAPTSPALANLCAYGLDVRLTAAARAAGAVYTRYADDLVFSGDSPFARMASRFSVLVGTIALEEGFHVQHRKTRLMRREQRQEITGLVVNERPAIPRPDFDRLRAILHNCAKLGPESQNRDGHPDFRGYLEGAVAWVRQVQPARGARLGDLFHRIEWPTP
jgi:RNA-directed DNA polymerase